MSKRWKVRKANAAKRERSREVIDQFYGNVITELERMVERIKSGEVLLESPLDAQQLPCDNRASVDHPTTIHVK